MELEPNPWDIRDGVLDEAPLTASTAASIERDCGAFFAADAPGAGGPLIAEEWQRLLPLLRERALSKSTSVRGYRELMWSTWGIVSELFDALHQNTWHKNSDSSKKPRGYWYHQQFDPFRAGDETRGFDISKIDLSQIVAKYLQCPEAQTNRLDWIFLDSIVLSELEAFSQEAMATRGGTGINWAAAFADRNQFKYYAYSFLFWAIGLTISYVVPIGLAYYLAENAHPSGAIAVVAIWTLWTLWKLVTYPFRFRARRRAIKLLQHLTGLYGTLGDNTISPMNLKRALETASKDGVVLDGAVFTIVDRAIGRDPTAFIPMQGG